MAIFDFDKAKNYQSNNKTLTENVLLSYFAFRLGEAIGTKIINDGEKKKIRKAMSYYEEENKDCAPIDDFSKKMFYADPSDKDKIGKEFTPEDIKKLSNIFKFNPFRYICYFSNNKNKPDISFCIKNEYTKQGTKTAGKIENGTDVKFGFNTSKTKKHEKYYTASILADYNMYTDDISEWANDINNKHK